MPDAGVAGTNRAAPAQMLFTTENTERTENDKSKNSVLSVVRG